MAKTIITVGLEVRELLYDIMNKAHLTGQARELSGVKGYESASVVQASESGEVYQLRRTLSYAYTTLKSVLSEYLYNGEDNTDNKIDDEIDGAGRLVLSFGMPSNYNRAAVEALGKGIHSYLVAVCLAEWFTITDKEDATEYHNHAAVSLERVKMALHRRVRPVRPKKGAEV